MILSTPPTVPGLSGLPDLVGLATSGTLPGLARQIRGLGGCARPIRLDGHRTEVHSGTGEVLRHLESSDLPAGQLLVRCGNRRVTRCPACAEVYRRDTFHLITAGLRGGKTVPATVAGHPRVFATFTAPSFGPVHNRPEGGRCRCGARHQPEAPELGTPLDPDRYDYVGAVLWNAHAGKLWARFSIHLRREIAKRAGVGERRLRHVARVSFAKVAEYQKRGAVHFHAVIRLDGPTGGDSQPPAWASVELLTDAIRAAARAARAPGPTVDGREHGFVFGVQLDVRPIRGGDFDGEGGLSDRAVAGYVAKYATKGAETATGTLDRPLRFLAELARLDITEHAKTMIRTAWALGGRKELEELRLRAWAHMLGFRGHFSTKTRRYSTSLGALRQVRAEWRRAQARAAAGEQPVSEVGEETTLVIGHWVFAGVGLAGVEQWLADSMTPGLDEVGEKT